MRLAEVIALLEDWYPPQHAESWDAVGLVCGDPDAEVRTILLAVDPVRAVADEAARLDADLLLVHHPLFLRGTTTVAANTPKGAVVHRLLSSSCALYAAHTNADSPLGGVSEAIARALGLREIVPLEPDADVARDKLTVYVPSEHAESLRAALADAGAGAIGDYDAASFSSTGLGRFRPLAGAQPAIGEVGTHEVVEEERIEVVLDRSRRGAVVAALLAAHPYEEPAFDVVELAGAAHPTRGTGRIGELPEPMTLAAFAQAAAAVFPATAGGLRVAGDPEQWVQRVGLVGGAGDSFLEQARRAAVDVYLTSDLRHHPASESAEAGGPALIDVAHWAAESLWLPVLRDRLQAAVGDTVSIAISTTVTDPWTFRV